MIDPQLFPKQVLQLLADELAMRNRAFEQVARELGGELTADHHNRPSRSIAVFGLDGLCRQIEVCAVLRNTKGAMTADNWTYLAGVAAWKDTMNGRLSWERKIGTFDELPADDQELRVLLKGAWERVSGVTKGDLSPKG
jgi:hypothetical protein